MGSPEERETCLRIGVWNAGGMSGEKGEKVNKLADADKKRIGKSRQTDEEEEPRTSTPNSKGKIEKVVLISKHIVQKFVLCDAVMVQEANSPGFMDALATRLQSALAPVSNETQFTQRFNNLNKKPYPGSGTIVKSKDVWQQQTVEQLLPPDGSEGLFPDNDEGRRRLTRRILRERAVITHNTHRNVMCINLHYYTQTPRGLDTLDLASTLAYFLKTLRRYATRNKRPVFICGDMNQTVENIKGDLENDSATIVDVEGESVALWPYRFVQPDVFVPPTTDQNPSDADGNKPSTSQSALDAGKRQSCTNLTSEASLMWGFYVNGAVQLAHGKTIDDNTRLSLRRVEGMIYTDAAANEDEKETLKKKKAEEKKMKKTIAHNLSDHSLVMFKLW